MFGRGSLSLISEAQAGRQLRLDATNNSYIHYEQNSNLRTHTTSQSCIQRPPTLGMSKSFLFERSRIRPGVPTMIWGLSFLIVSTFCLILIPGTSSTAILCFIYQIFNFILQSKNGGTTVRVLGSL